MRQVLERPRKHWSRRHLGSLVRSQSTIWAAAFGTFSSDEVIIASLVLSPENAIASMVCAIVGERLAGGLPVVASRPHSALPSSIPSSRTTVRYFPSGDHTNPSGTRFRPFAYVVLRSPVSRSRISTTLSVPLPTIVANTLVFGET